MPILLTVAAMSGCPATVTVPCNNGTCGTNPEPSVGDGPPRFFADPPFGVGFSCVTIGCDTEKPLVIENQGGGKLGIALVRTTIDTSTDYTVRRADGEPLPRPETPVFLGGGEKLTLSVRYVPSDGVVDGGAVRIEHWDAARAYTEAVPLQDDIPLTARAVGAPAASVMQAALDFGYVAVGSSVTLDVVVENQGSNSVLSAGPLALADPSAPDAAVFHPPNSEAWEKQFVNAGEATSFSVVFTPTRADAFFGTLELPTNDPAVPTLQIALVGTAVAEPRIAITEPAGDVVLPPMRAGETRTIAVRIQNLGGQELDVNADIDGGGFGFSVSPPRASLAPLSESTFAVSLASVSGGPHQATLRLTSNDPTAPVSVLRVLATVNAPQLNVAPASIQLGTVVQSWVAAPQELTLTNTGFGELTVSALTFDVGSSQQVQLVNTPPLPAKLVPGDAGLTVTVRMSAQSLGTVNATLLVASDSVDGELIRVPISGEVVTCEEGCPTANGIPSCSTGTCRVDSCVQGFHDPNDSSQDGCECSEDIDPFNNRIDIAAGCPGRDLGELHDNSNVEELTVSGTLHAPTDIDLFYFEAEDDGEFLFDSFGVVVELVSGPPGLQVCANIRSDGSGCGGLPTTCTTSALSVGNNGAGSDNKDVTVFVKWAPDAAPMCGAYRLRLRANGG